jgi:hypothetical protein
MTVLYKDWAPTAFDSKGSMLDDRQEWFVVPVMQTRDSDAMSESNFAVALRILGGEIEGEVEVHRFGHWGPGWFEIIIAHPRRGGEVDEIEASLADYPVLDDSDFSEREWRRASDWWMSCGMGERIRICGKYNESIFAARRDEIPEDVRY